MAQPKPIFLASASPRRSELLRQIGVLFQLLHAPVDETERGVERPEDYVVRLACAKASAGWRLLGGRRLAPVLGADTAVVLDGAVLGKPAGRDDGLRMLMQLSGRSHQVLTAVALFDGQVLQHRISCSQVTFRTISDTECASYWDSGECADKAGSYAIQGYGAVFVEHLRGSYSGVMGLPLFETAQLLDAAGISRWQAS